LIDSRAIIDAGASLSENVKVGPFSVIGPDVEIGAGTVIDSHVVIQGPTSIGRNNHFHSFASVGGPPQDKKYKGEPTRLKIGDHNTFFECVTINRGTVQDRGETTIGNSNWIMAYVHIAHDCDIRNNVIMSNNATLAGHITVEDWAILGGFTKIHQFCRIGAHSFTGMNVDITRDIPPYVMVSGTPATPHGINSEGLRRRGFDNEQLRNIKQAYKVLYRSGFRLEEAILQLSEQASSQPEVKLMVDFLGMSKRSIMR